MCVVYKNQDGELDYKDGLIYDEIKNYKEENLLETVFLNGKMVKEQSLSEVRNVLHNDKF